jgi:Xanthomonas XOO_2897-like deaminase
LENNPDHADIVFMSKGDGFQTPLSAGSYGGTGAASEENPGLFGRQIDNPQETELGQAAMAARIADGYTGGKNYAAFRCVDSHGNVFIVAGSSAPGTHSERVLGIPALEGGFTVTDVYTERQPCNDPGSYCGTWLQNYFGDDFDNGRVAPNVTYKYPYGDAKANAAARAGVKADAAVVVNNPDYVAPPVTAPNYTTPAEGEATPVVEDDG